MTDVWERFWVKVDRSQGPDSCWPWKACIQKATGYGAFGLSVDGEWRIKGAHRLAWELTNRQKIPKGFFACHTCDNRACCNPAHIYPGTPAQNMADKIARGRDRSQTTDTCYAGHTYTPATTMWIPGTTHKRCLICKRARAREASARYRLKRKGEVDAQPLGLHVGPNEDRRPLHLR